MTNESIDELFEKIDRQAKSSIENDASLNELLVGYLESPDAVREFIKRCLKNQSTREMLLRVQWYTELTHSIGTVRPGRPALQLIFLIAMAEGLSKTRDGKSDSDTKSKYYFKEFFTLISDEDTKRIETQVKLDFRSMSLDSFLDILYHARCNAVHGREFWLLSFKHGDDGVTLLADGDIGSGSDKRRVYYDTTMQFSEVIDIFIRTALANIEALAHINEVEGAKELLED